MTGGSTANSNAAPSETPTKLQNRRPHDERANPHERHHHARADDALPHAGAVHVEQAQRGPAIGLTVHHASSGDGGHTTRAEDTRGGPRSMSGGGAAVRPQRVIDDWACAQAAGTSAGFAELVVGAVRVEWWVLVTLGVIVFARDSRREVAGDQPRVGRSLHQPRRAVLSGDLQARRGV